MAAGFSTALRLTDLNDFLGPSQECIKPVSYIEDPEDDKKEKEQPQIGVAATEIRIDHDSNSYYEVSQGESSTKKQLKKAEITLNDCLACSGCITSAESVLVQMQSHEEVYKVLQEQPDLVPIMSIAPQSIASLAALHSISPAACLRKLRRAFREKLGFRFIFDTTFARHISLLEGQEELYEKSPILKGKGRATDASNKACPLLASACPGWICYAEKTHGELLPYISNVKSPQQIMGSLVKDWLAPQKLGLRRDQVYHVSVMPCYDKKLEASRPDFATEDGNREVDCVLTTGEVERMLVEKEVVLSEVEEDLDEEAETYMPSLLSHPGSASGGYLHNALAAAIRAQPQDSLSGLTLDTRVVRGEDYVDYLLRSKGSTIFRGAICYGFRNLQNVVRKVGRESGISVTKGAAGRMVNSRGRGGLMKRVGRANGGSSASTSGTATPEEPERGFDYIEVMACPSGCVNGGGQMSPPKHAVPPIELDREGMPLIKGNEGQEFKIVADEQDGHKVLSGKDWVKRVEEFYWQVGARRIVEPASDNGEDKIDASIKPYLVRETQYDEIAARVLKEAESQSKQPELARKRLLRTQYRAIESEEVNGLAVKW